MGRTTGGIFARPCQPGDSARNQTKARPASLPLGARSFFPRDGMVKVDAAKDDEARIRSRIPVCQVDANCFSVSARIDGVSGRDYIWHEMPTERCLANGAE